MNPFRRNTKNTMTRNITDESESEFSSSSGGSEKPKKTNHIGDTHSISSYQDDEEATETESAIAKRETKAIWGIKVLFVFVLFLSAAGALGVFFYIRSRENSEFEAQFFDDATKVLAAIGSTLEFTLGSADAFVASVISTAKETNQT